MSLQALISKTKESRRSSGSLKSLLQRSNSSSGTPPGMGGLVQSAGLLVGVAQRWANIESKPATPPPPCRRGSQPVAICIEEDEEDGIVVEDNDPGEGDDDVAARVQLAQRMYSYKLAKSG
ncbi:unnamed protein product [Dimorphilus gyrociliatus]|uniref:Uncharacterized protein n=1 Tax=Dimorphilus gyrociliatus TaxID=2664684 RepID=A0A7I8V8Y2_9ANNE|nr:unnamed protein product [Dimorphilus gyrociliatus]